MSILIALDEKRIASRENADRFPRNPQHSNVPSFEA